MLARVEWESNVPEELKRERQWVGWAPDPQTGSPKCPVLVHAKDRRASTRKPETWTTFDKAILFAEKYAKANEVGIGFVFTGGLVYVDVDCALQPDGELREWAKPYVEPFVGKAYMETSPSGKGLHIITKGALPGLADGGVRKFPEHATDGRIPEVAMFSSGKYSTITGRVWKGQKLIRDGQAATTEVWEKAGIAAAVSAGAAGEAPTDAELVTATKVPPSIAKELRLCTVADREDRSAGRFRFYANAARMGLTKEEVFSLVLASDWYEASGASEKGREHTWQDIVRSCEKVTTAQVEFEGAKEDVQAQAATWKDLGIATVVTMTKAGPLTRAVYGAANMMRVLERHPKWKGRLRHNSFKDQLELDGKPFEDRFIIPVAENLRQLLGWEQEPQHELTYKAVTAAAKHSSYNPVADMLRGLSWDGTERLDGWLAKVGCEDTPLNRQLGKKWLLSLVARAMAPGCKVDTVLVLCGEQERKKSTLFNALVGDEYFTDAHVTTDRDSMMVVHGHWVVELAELTTLRRANMDSVKQFVSARFNHYRPPYSRTAVKNPRHFVLVGTTNDEEFLTDPTGARRWWPVKVMRTLDVAWMLANRDQLLAEAVFCYDLGETWWFEETPEELREVHELRYEQDEMSTRVLDYAREQKPKGFSMASLMERYGWSVENRSTQKRVGVILSKAGFHRQRRRMPGAEERTYVWKHRSWPAVVDDFEEPRVEQGTSGTKGAEKTP